MISSAEEVYAIPRIGHHPRPKEYLQNYLFTKKVLIDVFCSEDMVFCFEDYYYHDIDLSMIQL